MKYLFLENKNGKVIRSILCCDKGPFFAVKRIDTGRFELWTNQTLKTNADIPIQVLSSIPKVIPKDGLPIPSVGILKQGEYSKQLQYDIKADPQDLQDSFFYIQVGIFGVFIFCFINLILQVPVDIQQVEKEFQVDIVESEDKAKTLIIENPFKNFIEKQVAIGIKKKDTSKDTSLEAKLNELLVIKKNTQKLKINLGGVFSSNDSPSSESKKPKNKMDQKLYNENVFSASDVSNKLEGISGYAGVAGKNQDYGDVVLLSGGSSSKSKQTGSKGGLSFEQRKALDAFMSKEEGVLRLCYEKGLHIFPGFKGDIYLSWKIDKKGKAQRIRVRRLAMSKSSSINLNEFKDCIIDHIKLWSFPLILNEELIPYTFQFNPSP